jgi:chromate transporter
LDARYLLLQRWVGHIDVHVRRDYDVVMRERSLPDGAPAHGPLRDVAILFLRLGATAFGGPAAHVALLEDEVVRKRSWVSRDEFLDLYSASNIIPGPNSTELVMHLGYRRAGWPGLVVAGACFILPAVFIVWMIAWLYVRFGARFGVTSIMQTLYPVVLAIVAQAMWRLGSSALRGRLAVGIAVASVVALLLGVHELIVLLVAAVAAVVVSRLSNDASQSSSSLPFVVHAEIARSHVASSAIQAVRQVDSTVAATLASGAAVATTNTGILLSFAKIGSVLFGSGYVLLAFLRREFVERQAWLTDSQLIDAITVGQVTPGPVFTTATFVGYLLQGNMGAMAATVGIFLPAFIFVALTARGVSWLRRWRTGATLLTGLNAASLALMANVVIDMAPLATQSVLSVVLLVVSSVLLISSRAGPGVLLSGAALLGIFRQFNGV